MYISIRKYRVKDAAEVAKQVRETYVPKVEVMAGFRAFYVVDSGDGTMTSVSIFETEVQARDAATKAVDHARETFGHLFEGGVEPEITWGEVVVSVVG